MSVKSTKCRSAFCSALGPILVVWGLVLFFTFPFLYDFIVSSLLNLSPGESTYNEWEVTKPSQAYDIYMFNWTNAEEVFNTEVKPKFEQLGPYRFWKTKEKYNVTVHDNGTLSFLSRDSYRFAESESPAQLTDVITTIDPIALTTAYRLRFYNKFNKFLISVTLGTISKLHISKTAKELLFGGYDDNLLDTVRPLSKLLGDKVIDKFGYFHDRNESKTPHHYNMYSRNDKNFGKIHTWNYNTYSPSFPGKCGELRGSSGEFFPMDQKKDYIEMFVDELCSSTYLEYDRDEVIEGITGYLFSGKNMFNFESSRSCFCVDECQPLGALNASTCFKNSPLFLSLPHFYNADPYYSSLIEGMMPDKDKHDFYAILEPKSAIPIAVGARAQMNMLLQPIPGISFYDKVPKVFIPVLYVDLTFQLRDDILLKLYLLQILPNIVYVLCAALLVLGGILTTCTVVKSCRAHRGISKKSIH